MKQLQLTQGRVTWVDDEDYPVLSRWKWQCTPDGYAVHATHINGRSVKILLHRFLLSPAKGQIIDHIDGNRLNNQRANLRIATRSQNAQNTRGARSISGFKGVRVDGDHYIAVLEQDGRAIRLGRFKCPVEAAAAYDRKALEVYGADAMTNEKMFRAYLEKLQSLK
jgi:hypothetical protein